MKVPTDTFIDAIGNRKVYYFSSTRLESDIPHYYVVVNKTDGDLLVLSVCTSQFDTVKRFVETRSLPTESLVYIKPDTSNPFEKETFVNCNKCFTYTIDEFRSMYDANAIDYSGELSEGHYEQILTGIHSSPLIEEEIKDIVPKPEKD